MTRADPAQQARRRASPEARREQILAAAASCFAERGFEATTMDDIARGARLSKGSLYWHFQNKRELFLAVLDAVVLELFQVWEERAGNEPDILVALEGIFDVAADRLLDPPDLISLWLEYLRVPEGRERLAVVYRDVRERLASLIDEGIARGQIRELSRESLAAAITACGEGLGLQAMVDPDFDLERHVATLWQVIRRGIEA